MTNQSVKREPVGNSSKVSKAERLNTWLPEIAAVLRPGAPAKAQPDGSVRIGAKGALSLGPGTGLWYDHAAGEGGRDALSLIRHLGAENPSDWITRFLADHDGIGSLSDAQDEFAESQGGPKKIGAGMIFREASANGYPLDGGEGKFGPAELLANMPSDEMELDEFPDPATEARTEIVGGFNSFTAASVHGPLPDRKWAVDQWFPARTVCMLFGAGGVGKSLIVQQLANKVAMGEPFFNIETMKMPVLCVMCEDDKDELSRRQLDINEWMGIGEFDSGPDNLWLGPRVGHDNILVTFPNQGEAQPGKFFIKLCVEIERVKGGAENVMVILDTAADLFGGNENVRREANTFVKTYLGSIVQRYNATIVLLAHPSLSGLASGSGLSGSTAWENSVRSRAYLHRGDDDSNIRTLSRMKSNYSGIGSENDIKLIWDKGVLTEIAEPDHLDRLNQTALKNDIMARVDIAWKDKNAFRARGLRGYKMLLPRLLPRHEPAAIAKAFIELITDGNVVLVKDKGFKTGQ